MRIYPEINQLSREHEVSAQITADITRVNDSLRAVY